MFTEFRKRLWLPPRPHGVIIEDREVSFLELFYDLVYVVVIARAAHHLAGHLTWRGVGEFAVVFTLIWMAWLNGTLLHELHGNNDVRSRVYIFIQMLLLALLAIYTGDAATDGGQGFAIVYGLFFALMVWLWFQVRQADSPEDRDMPTRYLIMLAVATAAMFISVPLDDNTRMLVWTAVVIGWIATNTVMSRSFDERMLGITGSLVERFGLFTIIVLGEVVVGVVEGLSEDDVERNALTVATALLALGIGFGFWWSYFDFVSRRLPKAESNSFGQWVGLHLPVTMGIAGAGAAMVSLVEHANDSTTPTATAWVLTGATTVSLLALAAMMPTLRSFDELPEVYRPVLATTLVAAGASLVIGALRPPPLMLALLLTLLLTAIWFVAIASWLRGTTGTLAES